MNKNYTLENKPSFKNEELVSVDMSVLGSPEMGILNAKVVGKSMEHVVDLWIVEFERVFSESYPFKVCSIPHVAIVNPNLS